MSPRMTGRRFVALALVVGLAAPAAALDPKAVEDEIKERKLAGAVGELHMLQAPPERAGAWMNGAMAGDPACQWLAGRCYHYGFTVPKDLAKAAEWYKKSVDQGYARAQLSYGRMLAAGTGGLTKDLDEAARLYRKAADQPDCPEAYEWLIQAYQRGFSVPKDAEKVKELAPKAVAAYGKLADLGYAGAQMRLARILTTGAWGTPVDIERGLSLYRKGLAQGHIYCQTNMGDAYANGRYGLPVDKVQGAKYYALAAAQGDAIAQASLVEMYLDGEVPVPDPASAEKLYAAVAKTFQAEAEKDPAAMYRLALMTEKGAGVAKNDTEAVTLLKKAAVAGSAPAALALAGRYDAGRGVPKDPAEAAKLREQAKPKKKAGEVSLEPATVTPQDFAEKVTYEQGILYVPENRADPKGRLIRVGFARFKATKPTTAPPVFYLPGGPGQSYLTDVSRSFRGFAPYLAAADVVVVDQRGFSPRGDTLAFKHKFGGDPLDRPSDMAKDTADFVALAKAAVADAKEKGIDLRGYTALECADDVNDLRKALGYDKITLCGTSFGSQWSFTTMRRHPGVIARALLSGVEPLDCGYDMPSHVFAAVQRMWCEAEKDPAIKPLLPPGGLTAAAREVLKRLDREPARVKVKDERSGEEVTVVLGKADFQRDFLRLADPATLLAVYQGRYAEWAKPVTNRRRPREFTTYLLGPLIDTSLGVTPQRGYLLRTDPGSEFLGHWNFDDYLATADVWPTADVGDDLRTEVVCNIPVVFAQGDWDTSTPVENLLTVVPYFPNSRVLIAEHGGHGVLGPIHRALPEVGAKFVDFVRTGDLSGIPARVSLPAPRFRAPPAASAAGE